MRKNDILFLRLILLVMIDLGLGLIWVNIRSYPASGGQPTLYLPTLAPTAPPMVASALEEVTPTPPVLATAVHINKFPASSPQPTATLPSPTAAPTQTPAPTNTAVPTPSSTAIPTRLWPAPDISLPTPATPIPTPMEPFDKPPTTTNILLLGNDVNWSQGGRTDTMIIVSINQETGTANMLSLPRDLYVYIPGWTMARLNTALPHGNLSDYPGGGIALLKDTILYNFGIQIDYYARIGFKNFRQIVNAMGGVEVVVTCPLYDWRLKSPDLDPNLEESWEQYVLRPGVHVMDGDLALWYARSRRTTNDFERGRRQQQLLRSMFNQAVETNLVEKTSVLWETFQESIDTDLTLDVILQLAAVAPSVQENGVQSLHLAQDGVRRAWRVPTTGEMVQLLQWQEAESIFAQLMQPPALSRANRPPITVEVVTRSDTTYRKVAENLAWYGFVPVRGHTDEASPERTQIYFFNPNFKGSYDWLLSWIFRQERADIKLMNEKGLSDYDYRVIVGLDHNPCLPLLDAPRGRVVAQSN